jgi:hypothetical protein
MAISADKLLNRPSELHRRYAGRLAMKEDLQKRIVQGGSTNIILTKKTIKSIDVIKDKVIEIDVLLKGTLAVEKKKLDQQKRQESGKRREKQEEKLETKPQSGSGPIKMPSLPRMGFLGWVKNFIGNIILGYFAVRLVKFLPLAVPIVKFIGKATDFVIDLGGKLLDGLVTFIDWGYKAYDATRGFMKNLFGENQAKEFDKLSNALDQFLNLALIVGMATAAGGGFGKPGRGPGPGGKPTRGFRGVTQGRGGQTPTGKPRITGDVGPKWWEKITSRLKGGPFSKLAGPLSKFAGSAIPFAGAAIGALDAKARFSRGEQLGGWMASVSSALDAFSGVAAATGLGLPIAAVATAISIGIDAVLLVSDIIKAFGGPTVPGMVGGGRVPVTRGGKVSGGVRRSIGSQKGKYQRTIPQKPGKVEITSPGADVGGKDKLFGIFPNPLATAQKVVDAINPFKAVKDAGEELGKTDYFGPILAISSKITAGQKPSQQDYQNVGRGLNLLIAKGIQDKQLKGGIVAAFAEGGLVDPDVLSAAETGGDITNWVAKTFQGEIESNAQKTLRMIRENADKKKYEEGTKGEGEGGNVGGTAGQFSPTGIQGDIYKYLLSKGMSDNHALGIMANIHRESGFRPGVSESGGPGVGLFQYSSGGRKSAFLKAVPDYATNWKGQIDFAIKEDVAPQYFKQNFSSAQDAADWWMRKWERPAEYIQNDKGPKIHAQYLAGLQKYKTQRGYQIPGSVGGVTTATATGSMGERQKNAGELGSFIKSLGVAKGSGVHEHPQHGGVKGYHRGRGHYEGRAIDIGGWGGKYGRANLGPRFVDDQSAILSAINQFAAKTGKKPSLVLHGDNDPGHWDHVHAEYEEGGETLPYPHLAMVGEKGKEIVIDADSAGPAKDMLLAINQAKGYKGVMQAIQQYAPYDMLAPQTIIMQSQQSPSGGYGSDSDMGGGLVAMFGGISEDPFESLDIGG